MKLFNNYSCIPLVLILSTVACSPIKIKSEKITQNPAIITAVPQEDLSLAGNLPVNSEKQTLDSWQHLISIFELSDVSNPRIERELKWFLAHPSSVNKFQTRAEPYIYNIIEEVKAKNLPAEFALLPAIESGYRAHAYSHSAAGLWQFIPSTGRAFKLEQNWWYDGRRDVHASTKAETKYLKQLAKRFDNDWLLALAAYNAGGGNVNRAVRRNREKNKVTDYWSLKLPNETQHYVPKLLALAKLFANAEEYGITLKKLEHKPYFSIVNIGSQLDLAKAAELSAMSIDDIFQINPGFNRGFTPPKGPHRLLIPVDKVSQFEENLALLPDTQRVKWQRHKIKSGENLSVIAQHYKIKTSVLRNVNHIKTTKLGAPFLLHETLGCPIANLHSARSDLWEPQFVLRPTQLRKKHCFVKSTSNDLTAVGITTCLPSELTSSLRIGELPCRLLRTKNHHFAALRFPDFQRRAGKYLYIPISQVNAKHNPFIRANLTNPHNKYPSYTVKSGDSLWSIARKFDLHSKDIARWNKMSTKKLLRLGQKLVIKQRTSDTKNLSISRAATLQKIHYTVRNGDSLSTISAKFNVQVADVRKWNKSKLSKYLKPGQKLILKVDTTKPST